MATDNDIADRHSDRATVTTAPPPPTSLADDQRLRQLIELFPRARPEYLADVFRGFQAHGEDAVAMAVQHLVEVKGGAGEELVGGSTSTSATRSAAR